MMYVFFNFRAKLFFTTFDVHVSNIKELIHLYSGYYNMFNIVHYLAHGNEIIYSP